MKTVDISLGPLKKAAGTLKDALQQTKNEYIRDAVIQRFEYTRPLRAGDVVTAQSTIESIREVGSNVLMNTRTELRTVAGELVCTAFSIIVERGGVGVA